MNDFFQDLWLELREKRLWPVAALLLVGIVAIPAVLTKSASDPGSSVAAADSQPATPANPTRVTLDTASASASSTGSSLDTFSSKDPFAPPKQVLNAGKAAAAGAGATAAGAGSGSGTPAPGGGGGSKGGDTGGGGDGGNQSPPAPPKTTEYEYVASVTFWNGNNRRKIKSLHKLEMLPNDSVPALIFMGVTGDGGDAVFLVDSTLSTTGEGNCSPSGSNCAFVSIGPGAEQAFTTEDGKSYRLRIDEIRRVKAGASAAQSSPMASTAAGATSQVERFNLPSLVDLVVTTTDPAASEGSSTKQEGR